MSSRIWLRRAYDTPTRNDGHRVLVDRIWPRGVSKEDARIDDWARELAPSDDLRRWFDHDTERWDGFQRRYRAELRHQEQSLDQLARRIDEDRVTLVTAPVTSITTTLSCSATSSNSGAKRHERACTPGRAARSPSVAAAHGRRR